MHISHIAFGYESVCKPGRIHTRLRVLSCHVMSAGGDVGHICLVCAQLIVVSCALPLPMVKPIHTIPYHTIPYHTIPYVHACMLCIMRIHVYMHARMCICEAAYATGEVIVEVLSICICRSPVDEVDGAAASSS